MATRASNIALSLILLVCSLCGCGYNLYHKFYKSIQKQTVVHDQIWDPAFELELNPNKSIVILFAPFRGGSSFIGQLFDHNPALQYLYEPFHDESLKELNKAGGIVGSAAHHTEADLRMLYLQQILHNCTMAPTAFYEKYEYCGSVEEHLVRFNSTECVKGLLQYGGSHQQICRYRNTTVLKVIRLQNLSEIMKIKNIKSANIKILHLTRHPVPMMMSRRTTGQFFYWRATTRITAESNHQQDHIKLAWEAFEYCYTTLHNIRYLESNVWMKERYMRLSHEELSLRPVETAETIYNFLNMTLTGELKDILEKLTSGEDANSTQNGKVQANAPKNSKRITERWKHFVNVFSVLTSEAVCSRLYKTFGLDNELDYLNSMEHVYGTNI